ncbi:MAG: type 4a pilus biogenesis protein PilO [Candidatus Riflebacteria bacterium]|nr:type 4a pilus biogenesis protein PilO [Candidatus Riflebacteria bacterium]
MNNFAVVFIVIVLAAAGAAGAFYFYYWQPAIEDREKLEQSIKTQEAKKAEIADLETQTNKIKEEIAAKQSEKEKLAMESNQLNTVVPKLLDSTEAIANKFNLKFQDIRISPLIRAEQWSELPIEVGVLGTYSDIASFLYVMEKRKIANLAAGSITITLSAETDPKTKSPLLSVTLNAKVYIMGGGY